MSKPVGCYNVEDPVCKDNTDAESCKSNLSQNGHQDHIVVEKRSLLDRQLEINMTPKMTQLDNSNADGSSPNTSRYGRARKEKQVKDFYPTDLAFMMKARVSRSPSKSPKKNLSSKTAFPYDTDTQFISSNVKSQNNNMDNVEQRVTNPKTDFVSSNAIKGTSPEDNTTVPQWKQTSNSKPPKCYSKKDMIQNNKPETKIRSVYENFFLLCNTTHGGNNSLPNESESLQISSPISQPVSKKTLSLKNKPNKTNLAEKSLEVSDGSVRLENEGLKNSLGSSKVVKTKQKSILNNAHSSSNIDEPNNELTNPQLEDDERNCTWQLGELLWARVGSHPYWPCLVTRDPFSLEFVINKKIGRSSDCAEVYHVTYFGDNGRRSWVVGKNLMKFEGLDNFNKLRSQITEARKKDTKYCCAFDVKGNKKSKWCTGVEEAEMVMQRPADTRVDFFYEKLSCQKQTKKKERKEKNKQTSIQPSLSESMLNNLFNTSSEISGLDVSHGEDLESSNNKNIYDVGDLFLKNLHSLEDSVECEKAKIQSHMDKWLLKAKKPVIPTTGIDKCTNDSVPVQTTTSLPKSKISSRRKSFSQALHIIQDGNKSKSQKICKRRKTIENISANDSQNEVIELVDENLSLNSISVGLLNNTTDHASIQDTSPVSSCIANGNSMEDDNGATEQTVATQMITVENSQSTNKNIPKTVENISAKHSQNEVVEKLVDETTDHGSIQDTNSVLSCRNSMECNNEATEQTVAIQMVTVENLQSKNKNLPKTVENISANHSQNEVVEKLVDETTDHGSIQDTSPVLSCRNSVEGNNGATEKRRRRNSVEMPNPKKQTLNDSSGVDPTLSINIKNTDSSAISKAKSRRKSVSCQKFLDTSSPKINTSDQNNFSPSSNRKMSLLNRRATIDCRYALDTDPKDKTVLESNKALKSVEDGLLPSKIIKIDMCNRYNDPEFIEFVEFKRDTLLEENPHMTEESQMSYLYKIWQYGKSKETDKREILDDYCLVKGMSQDINTSETRIQKNNDIKEVKADFKEVKTTSSPRLEKSLRKKNSKTYFVEDSDNESEFINNTTADTNITENHTQKSALKVVKKLKEKSVETQEKGKVSETQVSAPDYYMESLKQIKPNIFRGLQKEKVCGICEKPSGLVKCNGPCGEMFHIACVEEQQNPSTQGSNLKRHKKRGRKKINISDKSLSESNLVLDESSILDDVENDSNNLSLMIPPDLEDVQTIGTTSRLLSSDSLVIEAQKFELVEKKMQEMIRTDNSEAELDISSTSINTEHEWSGVNVGECVIVDVTNHKNKPTPVETKTNDLSEETKLFKCNNCLKYEKPLCFVCKSTTCAKNNSEVRQKCNVNHCNKYYHIECLDAWPQSRFSSGCPTSSQKDDNIAESFSCPRHRCHTCISDNPQNSQTRFSGDKLARCVRCPATYNSITKCVPAGTRVLTATQIICPKHYDNNKIPYHVNTSWCFICTKGGSLICCETCPISIHPECLEITPPEESYICEDCETGRLPLYEEVVWVKLGRYRWWPALILHPAEIPSNIAALSHAPNHFAVRFFGDYDHFWVDKARVFPFQEDDSLTLANTSKKSGVDAMYNTAMKQAKEALYILKTMKQRNVEDEELASSLLPPQYVKLKVNRPVGAVRNYQNYNTNTQKCGCDPNAENPCGPESNCLNRLLFIECSASMCAAGENCSNQAFEKRQYPLLAPLKTQSRGWGLHTQVDIKKGAFVIEYVGEIIDEAEFQRRMARMQENRDENYYFLTLDKDRMIDAGPKGNVARFMNHSCEPNCETQKWTVNGDTRVGLFAVEDIPAGSEVTFNYNLMSVDNEKRRRCMCGAKRCAGYIGAKIKQVDSTAKGSKKATPKSKSNRKNIDEMKKASSKTPGKIKGKLSTPDIVEKKDNVDKDLSLHYDATSNLDLNKDLFNSSNEESIKENLPTDNFPGGKGSLSVVVTPTESNPLLEPVMEKTVTEHQMSSVTVKNKRARAKSVYIEPDRKMSAVKAKNRNKRHSIDDGIRDICDEEPKAKRGRLKKPQVEI